MNVSAATLDRVPLAASTTDLEVIDLIDHQESLRTQGFRSKHLESRDAEVVGATGGGLDDAQEVQELVIAGVGEFIP